MEINVHLTYRNAHRSRTKSIYPSSDETQVSDLSLRVHYSQPTSSVHEYSTERLIGSKFQIKWDAATAFLEFRIPDLTPMMPPLPVTRSLFHALIVTKFQPWKWLGKVSDPKTLCFLGFLLPQSDAGLFFIKFSLPELMTDFELEIRPAWWEYLILFFKPLPQTYFCCIWVSGH